MTNTKAVYARIDTGRSRSRAKKKGMASLAQGKSYTADEVDRIFSKEYGI